MTTGWKHWIITRHSACHSVRESEPVVKHGEHSNSVRIEYIFHVCDSSKRWLSVQRSLVTPPCPPISIPSSPNVSTRYTLKLCCGSSIKHVGQGQTEFTELFSICCCDMMARVVKLQSLLPWERTLVQVLMAIMMIIMMSLTWVFSVLSTLHCHFLFPLQPINSDLWCIYILCLICSSFSKATLRFLYTYWSIYDIFLGLLCDCFLSAVWL